MALPKEPRQKMINMMYLVLTALLALNVSSEILNAFKTVNNSIATANSVVDAKNNTTYKSFADKLKKAETAEKAAMWWPKAEQAQKLSAAMSKYLDDLKTELKKESKGENIGTAEEHFSEDNLDASTRLLVEGAKGEELRKKLEDYKTQMLAIIPEAKDQFAKSLPLDMTVPKSQTGSEAKNWQTAYFHMTPTIAALTILSKFQNDVKNSEAQIVDYCHKEIGEVEVVFDQFQAFAGTNATYLMQDDELEITAGVGAFSKAAKPTITIGGATVPLNTEGVGVYKTKVSGTGDKSVDVKISYKKPDGTDAVVTKTVKYSVGVASGASIFLKKMNVVYLGVDNPVTISGGSVGSEKVKVSFTNGSITKAGKDDYVIVPSSVGPGTVTVNADGTQYKFELRCKMLPNPVVSVGGVESGPIAINQFKAMGGMLAKLKDSDFDAQFQVLGYKVGGYVNGIYQEAVVEGPRWIAANNLIGSAKPGSQVFFDNIRVMGPDKKVRSIPGTFFTLK